MMFIATTGVTAYSALPNEAHRPRLYPSRGGGGGGGGGGQGGREAEGRATTETANQSL